MSTLADVPRRAPFRLRTLGGAALEHNGATLDAVGAQRKMLALLALLAAARQRGISRERLAAYLWPESDAEHARGALKQALHVVRQQLGTPHAVLGTAELRLNPEVIESDVDAFVSALEEGALERAVAVYVGPFLDGFHLSGVRELERWIELQRSDLAWRHAAALEQLVTSARARGDHSATVRWWRALKAGDPLSSRITLGLMRALDAAGERAAAIGCAQAYQAMLKSELGSPPDPAVNALVVRLREASARVNGNVELVAQNGARPLDRVTEDAEAYELYLRARHLWKLRTPEGLKEAPRYYEAAVDRDPGFARAWAGLAESYVNISNFGYMTTREALALAERSADRAIELDARLTEAHAAKGFIHTSRLEFAQGEASFRRAIALNADYSFGHHYYTLLLLMLGRTAEACAQNREALRGDPLSRPANATSGIALCQGGDYDGAARELQRALALAPDFPLTLFYLGVVRVAQEAWDEALPLFERAAQQAPDFTGVPGALACSYRRAGRHEEVSSLMERLRAGAHDDRTRTNLAFALAALGNLDEALALMEQLLWDLPALIQLRSDPHLRPLRADSRYSAVLQRIGAGL